MQLEMESTHCNIKKLLIISSTKSTSEHNWQLFPGRNGSKDLKHAFLRDENRCCR